MRSHVLALESVDFGAEPPHDLHGVLARARETAPVVQVRFYGEQAWLVSRYEDVAAAYADEDALPSEAAYSLFAEPVQGRTLQCMSGPEHRVNRTLVSPTFRPSAVRALTESLLYPIAEELAAEMAGRRQADLVDDFAARLPFLVITRLLGMDGTALPELREWATALFSYATDPDFATAAAAKFTRLLTDLIARRRIDPRDDLLSHLATAEFTTPDGVLYRLTDEEIFSFIRLLFPAGADTTYRGIGSMFFGLLAHPGCWARVCGDPDIRPAAVEEALRWEPPVAIQPRRSVSPRVFGDITIPANVWVLFATAAANRDPSKFTDPARFDLNRPNGTPVLTFGAGPHYCLGAHLARAEMRASLNVLTAHFPRMTLAVPAADVPIGDAILRGPKSLPVYLHGGP